MTDKNNDKKLPKIDENLTFEEAMRKIANTPKEEVEKAIKEAEKKEKERDEDTPAD